MQKLSIAFDIGNNFNFMSFEFDARGAGHLVLERTLKVSGPLKVGPKHEYHKGIFPKCCSFC